jgi:3-hydroxybutyryl-CoA dehydrogenase
LPTSPAPAWSSRPSSRAWRSQAEAVCRSGRHRRPRLHPGTNTSSISVTAIGAALKHPERLAGLHFFNPAPLMALVEVVSGLATDAAVADTLFATAAAWGKTPVHAPSRRRASSSTASPAPTTPRRCAVLHEGAADCATSTP